MDARWRSSRSRRSPALPGTKKASAFASALRRERESKVIYDFVEYMKPSIEPGILDELNACKKENVELREINAALIRRDVKFEEMQAEIDALRNELKLARDSREATAVVETKQQPSQTKVIPPSLRGPKS